MTTYAPMLASAGDPPVGSDWIFEFKWDGMRAIAETRTNETRLYSRPGNNITSSYPDLGVLGRVGRPGLVLDGEIVAVGPDGKPDIALLQQRMHVRSPSTGLIGQVPVAYYVFDVLEVDGRTTVNKSYRERREILDALRLDGVTDRIRVPVNYDIDGSTLLRIADQHGVEGIVGKRWESRYRPGRSVSWVKSVLWATQEVVICGWREGSGRTLGALMMGAYTADGRLTYLGDVGSGFTEAMLEHLLTQLVNIAATDSPFGELVDARGAHWVHPHMVGEVQYRTRSPKGRLRYPSWRGLRIDKNPDEVRI